MVAHTATSPPRNTAPGGTVLQNGVCPSSSPSAPLPQCPSAPSASPPLRHSESSAFSSSSDAILQSLADPDASLASVARAHNITVAALTLWLARPDIQARVREMEAGAAAHVRLASSLNLSSAVRVLVRILDDFDALSRTHTDAAARTADPDYIRASERARKAAYHLYRLSRVIPISESDLTRARTIRGPASSPSESSPSESSTSASTASSAFKESCSSSPPRPSRSDTSSSVSCPDVPSSLCNAALSENSVVSSHSPSAFSSPSSIEDITVELESLAHSLGIDISDIDENAPLPPEFLATLPPELAAFIAHPPDIPDIPDPPESTPTHHSSLASG